MLTQDAGTHAGSKKRARLEVALNFFLVLKEIKFHQQAESQLISKHTKTNEPPPY